jgi:SNF family Na+-dependent transporter
MLQRSQTKKCVNAATRLALNCAKLNSSGAHSTLVASTVRRCSRARTEQIYHCIMVCMTHPLVSAADCFFFLFFFLCACNTMTVQLYVCSACVLSSEFCVETTATFIVVAVRTYVQSAVFALQQHRYQCVLSYQATSSTVICAHALPQSAVFVLIKKRAPVSTKSQENIVIKAIE